MNGEEFTNTEMVPAVRDAELIDDDAPIARRSRAARLAMWWRTSRRVPMALKSGPHARAILRNLLVRLLCTPWWFLRAVIRGFVTAGRLWRGWIKVQDYREAAELQEKLADKFTEIRELTILRWKVTGAVAGAVLLLGTALYLVYGPIIAWTVGGIGLIALTILGRRNDGAPGRKAVLSGPRALTWTMDPQILVDAFRDAKLIGKDEDLRLVERAHRQGDGWAVTVDLPATRKAADVLKHREALASALAVDEVQLTVERVRGRGGHAGRVALWVADSDPYDTPPLQTPLLKAARWDAWRAAPFGRDARDRKITLPLVWTSLLVGAIPRQGKTFAARLAAAGLILDPDTSLYIFDGKGGKDWQAAEQVAHRFVCGDEPAHLDAVRAGLAELVAETQARFARMAGLDDQLCPESKITPQIARDKSLSMPLTAVVVDEVQVYLEDPTRIEIGGRKTTMGAHIADLLTYLAKKGPAAGVIVILATQRPDSTTIPSRLRAVLGSRFALRVMDWRDSNIILGEQMNTRGYDSSRLLASHKGVGVLRPDSDNNAGSSDMLATTVRTYYMPNTDWRAICDRGHELRKQAGTLTGHAIGQETDTVDGTDVARVIGTPIETPAPAPVELPEPLASVVDYLIDDDREFVSTAELVEELGAEPVTFGRAMGECGCVSERQRITDEHGNVRQIRGYLVAQVRSVAERHQTGQSEL